VKAAIAIAIVALILVVIFITMTRRNPRAATHTSESITLVAELRRDVGALCALGQRNTFNPENLTAAADFIERELKAANYSVERQRFPVEEDGTSADNVIVELRGTTLPGEIVVIGAHYDSVEESPGADDNASGVAALLALARRFAHEKPRRTLRFVAFANEEPPHFQTEDMGSLRYATRCHDRGETIVAMLSIESIAYFSDAPDSQQYPSPLSALYPSTANFLAFVGTLGSRALVMQSVHAFREATPLPAEAAVLPQLIQETGWSDQWSFWQFGWPAAMVTDTAPFRNPHYHAASDRPETLDYERFASAVEGLEAVVRSLSDAH